MNRLRASGSTTWRCVPRAGGDEPDLPRLSLLQGVELIMRIILIVVSLAMLSAGCRQDPLAELREGAQRIFDDARTSANDVRELSAAEFQALWAIEYTSLEVAHASGKRGRTAQCDGTGAVGVLSRQ